MRFGESWEEDSSSVDVNCVVQRVGCGRQSFKFVTHSNSLQFLFTPKFLCAFSSSFHQRFLYFVILLKESTFGYVSLLKITCVFAFCLVSPLTFINSLLPLSFGQFCCSCLTFSPFFGHTLGLWELSSPTRDNEPRILINRPLGNELSA